MRGEVLGVLAHACLLGWICVDGGLGGAYRSSVAARDLRPATLRQVVRDPSGHLPLRGMDDFAGDTADACLRMEGFLISALGTLEGSGTPLALRPHQVPARLDGTTCAVTDPALAPLLAELDAAWQAAGRPPVGPLGQP